MAMTVTLQLFEALTEIGIKPEKAHAVEKQFEAAIDQASRRNVEDRMEHLATKSDIANIRTEMAELETRLHKFINDNNYKLIGVIVALNGAMMVALKLFSK